VLEAERLLWRNSLANARARPSFVWIPSGSRIGKRRTSPFFELDQEGHAGDEWISDGNFALTTFDIRLPRTPLVLWLNPSRLSCAWRALTRTFKPGASHRIARLPKVLAFIWHFDRVNRPRIEATRLSYGADVPVRRLKNDSDIAAFLSSYDDHARERSEL
jgi:hypothetical protein